LLPRYTTATVPSDIIDGVVRVVAMQPDIRAVYLFGSQAIGTARLDSDVDIGVLYTSRQPLARTLQLEDELAQALGRHVDVVDVAAADAFLALEIVRGERIFCRDSTATDFFDLYVLRRAGDLLPFERERQAMAGMPP
jgi:predicted nucleotidyltransferase